MQQLRLERLTIRAALALGFGLVLTVWIATGYNFTLRMALLEKDASEIAARYMQAQELLASVRAQVLLSSVYVRDALLDPTPGAAATYRRSLDETYGSIDRSLQQYVPVLDSEAESAQVERLRRETRNLSRTALDVLDSDHVRSPSDVRTLLNSRIVPRREAAIRISEQVQALNRAAFVRQQAALAELNRAAERRTTLLLSLALAGSFGIALLATLYGGRLESRLRSQSQRDALNTQYLQRLSAKLLTVQEEERRHIARELHDDVGQTLTALQVELALAEHALQQTGRSGELLTGAQSIADAALHSVRNLSHLLHPAVLDDLGLPAAAEWYLQAFAQRHQIKVEFQQQDMHARLAPEVETAAYRIIQEALTNVAKHAHASQCRLTIRRLAATIEVIVEDNGTGFDMRGAAGHFRGLGLVSMRERAAELEGCVEIESAPGSGTRVRAELPARARIEAPAVRPAAANAVAAGRVAHG